MNSSHSIQNHGPNQGSGTWRKEFLPKFSTFFDPGSQDRASSATLIGHNFQVFWITFQVFCLTFQDFWLNFPILKAFLVLAEKGPGTHFFRLWIPSMLRCRRRRGPRCRSSSWGRMIDRELWIHLRLAGSRGSRHRLDSLGSSWNYRVGSWSTCCLPSTLGTIEGRLGFPGVGGSQIRFLGGLQVCSRRTCPLLGSHCNSSPSAGIHCWSFAGWCLALLLLLVLVCSPFEAAMWCNLLAPFCLCCSWLSGNKLKKHGRCDRKQLNY